MFWPEGDIDVGSTSEGGVSVDDEDFPVISEVCETKEWEAESGHEAVDGQAAIFEVSVDASTAVSGAHGVDEDTNVYASILGILEGVCELVAGVVVFEDIACQCDGTLG